MDSLEYITIFKNLLHTVSDLAKNSIKVEFKESMLPIINRIVSDALDILAVSKRNYYNVSEDKRWDIQQRLRSHQKQLDELVERLSIVKECSKCKREFPATTRYYYSDISGRGGLRPECKKCHNNAKKEFYKKKNKVSL